MAVIIASKSERNKTYRLAAVAIREDGAIVVSVNGSPERPQPKAHAEARALRKAGRGAVLYVARVLANGNIACAH